jgi:hypothetical protein
MAQDTVYCKDDFWAMISGFLMFMPFWIYQLLQSGWKCTSVYGSKYNSSNKLEVIFLKRAIVYQSWAFATFFPFRYSLIRYFHVAICYRYSATFQKFAIRYSLYAIRYTLFAIRYSLYAIRYTLFAIRYSFEQCNRLYISELFKFYAGLCIRIDFNLDPVPALDFWGF